MSCINTQPQPCSSEFFWQQPQCFKNPQPPFKLQYAKLPKLRLKAETARFWIFHIHSRTSPITCGWQALQLAHQCLLKILKLIENGKVCYTYFLWCTFISVNYHISKHNVLYSHKDKLSNKFEKLMMITVNQRKRGGL